MVGGDSKLKVRSDGKCSMLKGRRCVKILIANFVEKRQIGHGINWEFTDLLDSLPSQKKSSLACAPSSHLHLHLPLPTNLGVMLQHKTPSALLILPQSFSPLFWKTLLVIVEIFLCFFLQWRVALFLLHPFWKMSSISSYPQSETSISSRCGDPSFNPTT